MPERRFAELVGTLLIGEAADMPDDIAAAVFAVARRTLELVAEGWGPPSAYRLALRELGVAGLLGRWT